MFFKPSFMNHWHKQQLTQWLQFYQIDSVKYQEAFSVDSITHIYCVWLNLLRRTRNILVHLSFRNIKYSFDSWSFMSGTTDLKYPRGRNIFIVWKWVSSLPFLTATTLSFNKLINLSASCQCLHITELSEQISEKFLNSCFISSHLLWQVSCDNLLPSKFFEAKSIWRLFMSSENPSNWFV